MIQTSVSKRGVCPRLKKVNPTKEAQEAASLLPTPAGPFKFRTEKRCEVFST